jgi:hypothetical protein
MAWMRMEWDRPSRSDYYQMQTAALVDNFMDAFRKKAVNATPGDMKIKFKEPEAALTPEQRRHRQEQAARQRKSMWAGLLGMPPDLPPEKEKGK